MNIQDINFLTPEYQRKLSMQNILKICAIIVISFLIIEAITSTVLQGKINKKNIEIATLKTQILNTKQAKKNIVEKSKLIPDLTGKIKIIADMFSQQSLRFSEVLYNIKENTPPKLWYTDFSYSKNKILLSGIAANNRSIKSDINVLNLERNLNSSGRFINVKQEYIKTANLFGNRVSEFRFELILKQESQGGVK